MLTLLISFNVVHNSIIRYRQYPRNRDTLFIEETAGECENGKDKSETNVNNVRCISFHHL